MCWNMWTTSLSHILLQQNLISASNHRSNRPLLESQFKTFHLHSLPRRPPHILFRSHYRYCLLKFQTDLAVNGYEVVGPVCGIFGPEQGVWRLGQERIPVDPGGLRSGSSGLLHTLILLVQIKYGGLCGRILWRIFPIFFGWGDSGGAAVSHNFQFGVVSGGDPLGLTGGGGRRRPIWVD